MFRKVKLTSAALLALAPAGVLAQGDGLASLDAIVNENGAEAWAICTMASAYLGDGVSDPAEKALRDRETEMLVEVAVVRFTQQQGLTLEQAKARFTAVITARAPLYEDGSATDLIDRGKCILAGMVSADGQELEPRLVAAYDALPPIPSAPAAPPAPAPVPAPAPAQARAPQATAGETYYSAALGQGDYLGVSSYYIAPDGTLIAHWSFNGASSAMYGENAFPRVRGQGLAGSYTTRGTSIDGAYEGSLEITEIAKLEGDAVTFYRMVWDGGNSTGYGLWLGDTTLVGTFGGSSLGQFYRSEDGQGWELYLVTETGGAPALGRFRFEGGQFEGSHRVLGGEQADRPLGTASFSRDGADVIRIAMPGGETVVAVCNRRSIMGC